MTSTPTRLRHNRDFQLLCASQGLSMLGSAGSGVALPLLVLRLNGSPFQVGLVNAVMSGALALCCLPAGALVDRGNRRRVLLLSDTGRALATVAIAVGALVGHVPLALLLAAGALMGALGAPFTSANAAALRQIVPLDQLPTAMSVNVVRGRTAYLLGPVLGAALFTFSSALPFWLDAATFGVSLACIAALRTPLDVRATEVKPNWRAGINKGIHFLWRDKFLRSSLLVASAQNFLMTGIYLTVVVDIAAHGTITVGVVVTINGVGALLGGLLAPRIQRRWSAATMVVVTTVGCAVLSPAMAFTRQPLVLALLMAGCSVLIAASSLALNTARTLRTPPELQGRADSTTGLLFMSTPVASSLLAGALLGNLPPATVFGIFGGLFVVLAVVVMFRNRPEPPG